MADLLNFVDPADEKSRLELLPIAIEKKSYTSASLRKFIVRCLQVYPAALWYVSHIQLGNIDILATEIVDNNLTFDFLEGFKYDYPTELDRLVRRASTLRTVNSLRSLVTMFDCPVSVMDDVFRIGIVTADPVLFRVAYAKLAKIGKYDDEVQKIATSLSGTTEKSQEILHMLAITFPGRLKFPADAIARTYANRADRVLDLAKSGKTVF